MKILLRVVLGLAGLIVLGVVIALALNVRRESRLLERFPPPGQMVDVGGRRFHLQCQGSGTNPVVIFENGAFASTIWYRAAFAEVAQVGRVLYVRPRRSWME